MGKGKSKIFNRGKGNSISGFPYQTTFLKKDKDDPRRDRRSCEYFAGYINGYAYCKKNQGCPGSSYCLEYVRRKPGTVREEEPIRKIVVGGYCILRYQTSDKVIKYVIGENIKADSKLIQGIQNVDVGQMTWINDKMVFVLEKEFIEEVCGNKTLSFKNGGVKRDKRRCVNYCRNSKCSKHQVCLNPKNCQDYEEKEKKVTKKRKTKENMEETRVVEGTFTLRFFENNREKVYKIGKNIKLNDELVELVKNAEEGKEFNISEDQEVMLVSKKLKLEVINK